MGRVGVVEGSGDAVQLEVVGEEGGGGWMEREKGSPRDQGSVNPAPDPESNKFF